MKPGSYVFGAGLIAVLFVMATWWTDVIKEAQTPGDHTPVVALGLRYGMILFIASEVMFFVAWFWAFFDAACSPAKRSNMRARPSPAVIGRRRASRSIDPWHLPLLNTLILLTSGTTVTWAHHALLNNDRKGLVNGLILTILLGMLLHLRAGL